MKTRFLSLIIMASMALAGHAAVEHLLPKPQQISTTSETFSLSKPIRLITPGIGNNDPAVNTELTNLITTNGGSISDTSTDSVEVKLVASVPGAEFQNEAYSIQVTNKKVTISAKTLQGAFWATQTLWQLSENVNGNLQGCNITDWAAFHVRGYMLDIGRSYVQFDEVKKEIANLARYKINVFHWHLTENQGWRLESKKYPQLNASANYTRHPGKFYTMAQARELVQWCSKHGVLLIPEIDVPGHSDAFTRTFGFNMQTTQGLVIVKELMAEAIDSCFSTSPILHIGTDEVSMTMTNFVPDIVTLIRSKGLKVGTWKRGYGSYNVADLGIVNVWAGGTAPLAGAPNVDCRYHYLNHFDQFADVVGMYNSSILEVAKETADRVGVVMAIWNDRLTRSDRDIVIQNALYPSALAIAERAWMGGGTYITTKGVVMDNPGTTGYSNFADWERRFLFQKANFLKNEPIAYVKQSNIQWRITDAYPNGGTLTTSFPHESTQTDSTIASSCTYNGTTYNSKKVNGAGIYLRHTWGTGVPAFYSNPQTNSTAYAYTWVYSPKAQTVGAIIEFQNYGRSESDVPARQGKWDYKESRVWVNNQEILPPTWESQHTTRDNETALTNENFSARNPISVNLNKGWNKVFMKLPVGAFSISQVRLVKWSFTFAFVTPDGKNAVDSLVYSPDKNLNNPSLDILITAIDNAYAGKTSMSANSGTDPGQYDNSVISAFSQKIADAIAIRNNSTLSDAIYLATADSLNAQTTHYKAMVSLPKVSTAQTEYWYSLTTPLRNSNTNNCVAYQGDNTDLKGEIFVSNTPKFLWKLTKNNDGTYNIISKVSGSYISPNSGNNTALKAQTGTPVAGGWTFIPIYGITNYFAIVSNTVQFNQTNSGLSYKIYNWGGGTNFTDTGCEYTIRTEQTNNLNKQKIACVGNSITYGYTLASPSTQSYPAQLQNMLGTYDWTVTNYGVSSRTMLKNGNLPYWNETAYTNALASNPNLVIIELGTNDAKTTNWNTWGYQFSDDYKAMIKSFRNVASKPEMWIALQPPGQNTGWTIYNSYIKDSVNTRIKQVAIETGTGLLDLYSPFNGDYTNSTYFYTDGVHPTMAGAGVIAQKVYDLLTAPKPTLIYSNGKITCSTTSYDSQWYRNDTAISVIEGGKSLEFTPTRTGTYKLSIQPSATSESRIISNSLNVTTLTSENKKINNTKDIKISVSKSVYSTIKVEFNQDYHQYKEIRIFNTEGKMLLTQPIRQNLETISFNNNTCKVLVVEVLGNTGSKAIKIIL